MFVNCKNILGNYIVEVLGFDLILNKTFRADIKYVHQTMRILL